MVKGDCACVRVQMKHRLQFSVISGASVMFSFLCLNIMFESARILKCDASSQDGKKIKQLSLQQAVKAHRVVRRRGSHIFSRQSAHRGR
jgi:hypothetical protein